MIVVLLWIGLFVLIMPWIEYVSHRWFMHRPTLGKRNSVYREHHVEHHHLGLNEQIHVDMHLLQINNGISGAAMVSGIWLVFGAIPAATWLACLIVYGLAWTAIHRSSHDLSNNWLSRTWYGRKAIEHHLAHHERPYCNFGTVFWFTDWFLFTKGRR